MNCEKCGKEIDGSFGSGRFCSRSCANSRIRTEELKQRVSKKLKKIPDKFCFVCKKKIHSKKYNICISCRYANAKNSRKNNKHYFGEYSKIYRKNLKKEFVEYKGGKCQICGYNKCYKALHFHHINSSLKEFEISDKSLSSLEKAKNELNKCMLVCSNCHSEIHDGLIKTG